MKSFYWISFILSIFIILLNFGLFLWLSSIILIPLLVLHVYIGIKLHNIRENNILIFLSATNLLIFSLVRIDGVHVTNGSGFSELMDFMGFRHHFNSENENILLLAALLTFALQIIIDIILVNKIRSKSDLTVQL